MKNYTIEDFKVNDKVVIVDTGLIYLNYKAMFHRIMAKENNSVKWSEATFEKSFIPENISRGLVLGLEKVDNKEFMAVILEDNRVVIASPKSIIRVEDIDKIEKPVKIEKTFFEIMADHKPGQVWISYLKTIGFSCDGSFTIEHNDKEKCEVFGFDSKTLYTLIEEIKEEPEKIGILEALKARAEGKTIRSCVTDVTYSNKGWCDSIRVKEIEGEWTIDE